MSVESNSVVRVIWLLYGSMGVDMTKQTYHILYDWPSQPKVMPPFWPRMTVHASKAFNLHLTPHLLTQVLGAQEDAAKWVECAGAPALLVLVLPRLAEAPRDVPPMMRPSVLVYMCGARVLPLTPSHVSWPLCRSCGVLRLAPRPPPARGVAPPAVDRALACHLR